MIKLNRIFFVLSGFVFFTACRQSVNQDISVSDSTRLKAISVLKSAVRNQSKWIKVHAAEYLLKLNYSDDVYNLFKEEEKLYGGELRYRTGIWRILALSSEGAEKQVWLDSISKVYRDTLSKDRIHATEALAKLGKSPFEIDVKTTKDILTGNNQVLSVFTHWGIASSEKDIENKNWLFTEATTNRSISRIAKLSAYALRHLKGLSAEQWKLLANEALLETDSTRVFKLSAAYVTASADSLNSELLSDVKLKLLNFKNSENKEDIKEMCLALAENGTNEDIHLLADILNAPITEDSPEILKLRQDVEVAASYAILRIDRRQEYSLSLTDWTVIGFYTLGLLIIGWYYSRKNKTVEDYLLGGRNMNPVAVGISLFASLLSTLSYLAYPGEMIKYGPIIFTGILAFPFIYYTIGWWLIPRVMKMNVTSAYEILEYKLGLSIRMMAIFFFLSLRFLWMATIMYVTIYIALLSVTHIDESFLPVLSILLIVITIIYTAMGGLKAVVVTDVAQTVIFLGGAVLSIAVVVWQYGSLVSWMPDHWLANWSKPKFGFDLNERLTVGNAVLTLFLWYICTVGSDQIALQRYLSTKDVKAARKTLSVSLYANLIAKCLLALVGLAMTAFFAKNPNLLADGKTLEQQSDTLFPRFILVGLPSGISGLVIAGLLAAAMSSLSAGLNSVSSVISEDILKRFKIKLLPSMSPIKQIKMLSYFVGAIVVILSFFIGDVEGNLIDLLMKVVNLFVAPLFVLFFLALFVPFATERGTFIAGIVSVATAISIAFFQIFGITVLWITPISLLTGVVAGIVLSYLDRLFSAGER